MYANNYGKGEQSSFLLTPRNKVGYFWKQGWILHDFLADEISSKPELEIIVSFYSSKYGFFAFFFWSFRLLCRNKKARKMRSAVH